MADYSSSFGNTVFIEDGNQVYPCRCGITHRGDYALYDYMHHQCFHDEPLVRIDTDDPDYLVCAKCGQVFRVKNGG